jgi:hypothetical protein
MGGTTFLCPYAFVVYTGTIYCIRYRHDLLLRNTMLLWLPDCVPVTVSRYSACDQVTVLLSPFSRKIYIERQTLYLFNLSRLSQSLA